MRFLVISFKENLQNELVSHLYKYELLFLAFVYYNETLINSFLIDREQVMADAMKETEDVASKRRQFREMRELLHRASEIVNEVRH